MEPVSYRPFPAGKEGNTVPKVTQEQVSLVGLSLPQSPGKCLLRPREELCLRAVPDGLKRRPVLPFPEEMCIRDRLWREQLDFTAMKPRSVPRRLR